MEFKSLQLLSFDNYKNMHHNWHSKLNQIHLFERLVSSDDSLRAIKVKGILYKFSLKHMEGVKRAFISNSI